MMRTLILALSLIAASAVAVTAEDAKKKCPEGTVFDEDRGKCVVDKGS